MTAYNCLPLIAIALVMMMGWGSFVYAADDGSSGTLAPDGTPVIHKSLHKKNGSSSAAATTTTAKVSATTTSAPANPSLSPTVETGLPVARHSDTIVASGLAITPAPSGLQSTLPRGTSLASSIPLAPPGSVTSSTGLSGYSTPDRPTTRTDDIVFTNFPSKTKNSYPWKTNIFTTMFYIGEGGSSISPTTNHASSWDQEWESSNRGSDNPNDRNGYASGSHASTVNPFYIALPFNDLVYPDKARRWLPPGWRRPNKDGKPVSACKDRWVEIKTEDGSGHICYAQWEDVGPLRYDHAEYVFGNERPNTYTRAGLDVSPAVAQYLGIDGTKRSTTRWRFVDDEDVPPGAWLKYEEQAVIYNALHNLKNTRSLSTPSPQKTSQPLEDPTMLDSNKKKVGAAKG